jgi:hypothetical protein
MNETESNFNPQMEEDFEKYQARVQAMTPDELRKEHFAF